MNSPTATDALSLEALKRIETKCTQFEELSKPSHKDISDLLGDSSGLERAMLLCELVKLDIELRGERKEVYRRSDYEDLFALVDTDLVSSDFWSEVTPRTPQLSLTSSQFDFLSISGSGGIGEVWRVYDRKNERFLALKLLRDVHQDDPVARSRLHFEGLLTGTLQHPGIPPVYERGNSADGTPYFAMKLVDGRTLESILADRENVLSDIAKHLSIFEQVAQTLAYAHSQSVIHRDVKPDNVMVGKFGEVQVMDWGLAKRLDDEANSETFSSDAAFAGSSPSFGNLETGSGYSGLTTVGDIVGTPEFMSPEQARGDATAHDPRADVFGLGAILFQILTGEHLFPNIKRSQIVEHLKNGDISTPMSKLAACGADPELVDLCRECLSPDLENRPANAEVVADATRQYLAGIESRLRKSELEQMNFLTRRAEERKRHRWIIGLSSLTAAVAIFGALAVANQWHKTKTSELAERKARRGAESEATTVHEINEILNEILSSTRPDKHGFDVSLREVIGTALPKLDGKFVDKPLVEGVIRSTLGESYRWLGDYEIAENQFRQSMKALSRVSPTPELELLETKARLASLQLARGRSADRGEAEELATEVMQRRRVLLGPTHESTIASTVEVASILKAAGKLDESYDLTLETIELIETSPELESVKNIDLMMIQADLQKRRGNLSEAIASYQMLKIDSQLSETQRLYVLTQLGEAYDWKNFNERAAVTLREAYEGRERHLGPMHRDTLSSLRKLTRTMDEMRRFEENIALLTISLERHVPRDGPVGMSVFQATTMMAKALAATDETPKAIELLRQKVDIFSQVLGANHEYSISLKKQLSDLLQESTTLP